MTRIRAARPRSGRATGRKPANATTANALFQAAACCGTANSLYRNGDIDSAMDQARLAIRFLCSVVAEEEDR